MNPPLIGPCPERYEHLGSDYSSLRPGWFSDHSRVFDELLPRHYRKDLPPRLRYSHSLTHELTCIVVLLYLDMKYGLKFALWDQETDTEEELTTLLKGFSYVTTAPLYTVVMWVEIWQVGLVQSFGGPRMRSYPSAFLVQVRHEYCRPRRSFDPRCRSLCNRAQGRHRQGF